MDEQQMSNGKLAFKLYNKKDATVDEIRRAKSLVRDEQVDKLDIYGKFVWAQIILDCYWAKRPISIKAFEIFVELSQNKETPKSLLVGAYRYIGHAYEIGNGTLCNRKHALDNYVKANELNNKVCKKDIDRVTKLLYPTKPPRPTDTPEAYRYKFRVDEIDDDLDEHLEEVNDYRDAACIEHLRRMKTLKRTGFYYEDEEELISLADLDLYCVDGVGLADLVREKKKPMRLDEYDEYGYVRDWFDDDMTPSIYFGLSNDDVWWEEDDETSDTLDALLDNLNDDSDALDDDLDAFDDDF